MAEVTFKYDPWDDIKDVLPERPGNMMGYTAINSSVELRPVGENLDINSDPLTSGTIQGIIEMIAGGIEWLRFYGLSPAEVQSKVEAFKRVATTSPDPRNQLRYVEKNGVEDEHEGYPLP